MTAGRKLRLLLGAREWEAEVVALVEDDGGEAVLCLRLWPTLPPIWPFEVRMVRSPGGPWERQSAAHPGPKRVAPAVVEFGASQPPGTRAKVSGRWWTVGDPRSLPPVLTA